MKDVRSLFSWIVSVLYRVLTYKTGAQYISVARPSVNSVQLVTGVSVGMPPQGTVDILTLILVRLGTHPYHGKVYCH